MTQDQFNAAINAAAGSEYTADCARIIEVARNRLGIEVDLYKALMLWQSQSAQCDASWLMLEAYTDGDIVEAIEAFVDRHT